MNYGFVKVAAAVPHVKVADCKFNVEKIESLIAVAEGKGVQIIIFPEMSITGYTCGDLFGQQLLLEEAEMGLMQILNVGDKRLIIPYRGWNICLLVCYDLRFPVWSRNVNNEYDLLIYVANWPIPRRLVWDTLLRARALENQCYVCGVNRVGIDGYQLTYNGGSRVYSAFGEEIGSFPDEKEGITTVSLNLNTLNQFREKFPVWKDADEFHL